MFALVKANYSKQEMYMWVCVCFPCRDKSVKFQLRSPIVTELQPTKAKKQHKLALLHSVPVQIKTRISSLPTVLANKDKA